mmetsp:Transcript_15612/g.26847  ORF Transcript_15612/g.26847 Transcript_15612/m.26847 type:complete len:311 (+) Transcript_15612:27-959(+)
MFGLRWAADVRMLAFETIYFVSTYLAWNYIPATFSFLAIATFLWLWGWSFVGAVAVHNCVHTPPFKSSTANRVWKIVLTLTIGLPVSTYVPGHNFSHHKYIESRRDIMRTVQMTYDWNLLNLLLFFPAIFAQTQRNDMRYFKAQRQLGREIWLDFRNEMIVWWGVYIMLAMLDVSKFWWWVFLPHLLAKDCIVSLNMLQHDCCDPHHRYNFARNFVGDTLNFFCYNNGYHTIHHMYPGKHWSTLKEEHEKKVKPFSHPNLDQPSIFGYIFHAYVYPGKRVMYDGSEFILPDDAKLPIIDWAVNQVETSDG